MAEVKLSIRSLKELNNFALLLSQIIKTGDTIILEGEIGAGKTTLCQAMAKGLGISDEQPITSPTFSLLHEYSGKFCPVWHIDCYRLSGEDDIEAAGLGEYIASDKGIKLIEWGSILGYLTPKDSLQVFLANKGEEKRELTLQGQDAIWAERLADLRNRIKCL